MKLKATFLFLFFICTFTVFSQDKNIKHKVEKGDTITNIALKYNTTPFDIYKLNPDAKDGITLGETLLVPNKNQVTLQVPKNKDERVPQKYTIAKTHVVLPKETLYSISKIYNIDTDLLKNNNKEELKDGLKVGQTLKIPSKENAEEYTRVTKIVYHTVKSKETKYGIAKQYGVTVEDLEKQNPEIVDSFNIGTKLSIFVGQDYKDNEGNEETVTQTYKLEPTVKEGYANYEVKQGETLFSLSQDFGKTQDELIALNPSLKNGVKTGMILLVPGVGSLIKLPTTNVKYRDLTKTLNKKTKKELVFLLPFNATKIQSDTLKTVAVRLKKDVFLNMTLDFYSGALMAIDSAKVLGLNIDVKFYDSEETKLSSSVKEILKNKSFKTTDAVIGPFYQQYVDEVAEILNDKKIPVISPLSKEIGKSISNSYQSITLLEYSKMALMDYMLSKAGNIIIVSDPKKQLNKDFIAKNYPTSTVKVTVAENGAIDVNQFKSLFVSDKINYVILDTERTSMILAATNIMLNQKSNFQTQLVILEPNETLNYDEISIKRLTLLKMLYCSPNRDLDTDLTTKFEANYKKINKQYPTQYAKRGFDITLDTMLRLSQNVSFEETATNNLTEQIDNRFDYSKIDNGGYVNKGVFIFEYQEDLSTKLVN